MLRRVRRDIPRPNLTSLDSSILREHSGVLWEAGSVVLQVRHMFFRVTRYVISQFINFASYGAPSTDSDG